VVRSTARGNFVVEAPDSELAARVKAWAERSRQEIQARWLGGVQPDWSRPVQIVVHQQHPGYFATEFTSEGTARITLWAGDAHLESTVRHEVSHAVLHLQYPYRPIPRWLDEGIAVCNESPAEQARLLAPLQQAQRRFSVRQLADLENYPREVGLFYAQSYSLTDHLVCRHGERQVIRFLEVSFRMGQEPALRLVLGYASFEELDREWWRAVARET
jgi:hypothetical protein